MINVFLQYFVIQVKSAFTHQCQITHPKGVPLSGPYHFVVSGFKGLVPLCKVQGVLKLDSIKGLRVKIIQPRLHLF